MHIKHECVACISNKAWPPPVQEEERAAWLTIATLAYVVTIGLDQTVSQMCPKHREGLMVLATTLAEEALRDLASSGPPS